MTTFYVSPAGDDSNDGLSPTSPKETRAAAQALAVSGDTVVLSSDYHETGCDSLTVAEGVTLQSSGAIIQTGSAMTLYVDGTIDGLHLIGNEGISNSGSATAVALDCTLQLGDTRDAQIAICKTTTDCQFKLGHKSQTIQGIAYSGATVSGGGIDPSGVKPLSLFTVEGGEVEVSDFDASHAEDGVNIICGWDEAGSIYMHDSTLPEGPSGEFRGPVRRVIWDGVALPRHSMTYVQDGKLYGEV